MCHIITMSFKHVIVDFFFWYKKCIDCLPYVKEHILEDVSF